MVSFKLQFQTLPYDYFGGGIYNKVTNHMTPYHVTIGISKTNMKVTILSTQCSNQR